MLLQTLVNLARRSMLVSKAYEVVLGNIIGSVNVLVKELPHSNTTMIMTTEFQCVSKNITPEMVWILLAFGFH